MRKTKKQHKYDAKNKLIMIITKKFLQQASVNLNRQKEKERELEKSAAKKALQGF